MIATTLHELPGRTPRKHLAGALACTFLSLAVASGCRRDNQRPEGRIYEPIGGFSYVAPDGWFRLKDPDMNHTTVGTYEDAGKSPQISVYFVHGSGAANDAAERYLKHNRKRKGHTVVQNIPFVTDSGLTGFKISARLEDENIDPVPVALHHYMIQNAGQVIGITCVCADSVNQKYEPVFDKTMKSMRSEPAIGQGSKR